LPVSGSTRATVRTSGQITLTVRRDVFELQDAVAQGVAGTIAPAIEQAEDDAGGSEARKGS